MVEKILGMVFILLMLMKTGNAQYVVTLETNEDGTRTIIYMSDSLFTTFVTLMTEFADSLDKHTFEIEADSLYNLGYRQRLFMMYNDSIGPPMDTIFGEYYLAQQDSNTFRGLQNILMWKIYPSPPIIGGINGSR